MGFLEKRNPRATRQSVIRWAWGGGIGSCLFALVQFFRTDMPVSALFFLLPWMTVVGAIAGAAVEWQLDD